MARSDELHERALTLAFLDRMIRASKSEPVRNHWEQQRREAVEKNRQELAGK